MSDRDADERRHGGVRATLAVERSLQLGIRAVERVVVPVEATARLGGRDEQPEQDGAEERLVLGRSWACMGAGEDPGCRLALQLLERDQRVLPAPKPGSPLLDERAHERAVLVQRRPTCVLVLDERDGQLGAFVQLPQ